MMFDVIIGNPPYQLNDAADSASASPLYHKFVEQAIAMDPRYIAMIIPARWYMGGKGLSSFRKNMVNDTRIKELHDFPNAKDCFPQVAIGGGVCYFLRDNQHDGPCAIYTHNERLITRQTDRFLNTFNSGIFVRDEAAVRIIEKCNQFGEPSMAEKVSASKPFGLRTYYLALQEAVNRGQ